MSNKNLSKPGRYSFTKFYTHNNSIGRLSSSPRWPVFYSYNGIVNASNRATQQQTFNNFFNKLYKKFNKEHLEILEIYNNTKTEQIL
ncbi:3131_t:CDS:1, partial [Cetraspora pellucida]